MIDDVAAQNWYVETDGVEDAQPIVFYMELRLLSKISAINPPEVTAEGILQTLNYDVAAALGNIKVPALILSAEFDHIIRPVSGSVIASKIDHARHIEVASGHLSLMEHAVELNVVVNDFLESPLFEQATHHGV